ncbi:hypothetical protein [Enterobacter kobei]|uniref:hypothetical protein n=1 Tax=Enterobacter kobei TaxID=208224 RepID=UPI00103CE487|nr:hypothetical protein [Enterobacter kobei]
MSVKRVAIHAVEKMAELMQQMEESSPRVAALQYCLTQLEARCAALAAELSSVLTDRAVILEDLDNTCFEIGMQRGEKAEAYPTPVVANHDAFLAEVRAQGVERLANAWYAIANETDPGISISDSSRLKYRQRADDAADFANEIRQEAAQ